MEICNFWNDISAVKKLYDKELEPICEKYHLQRKELDILLFLANNPEFDTATDIVERKYFTKSHVSAALKLMESKGYLVREFHAGNRKTIHIRLLDTVSVIVLEGQQKQKAFWEAAFHTFTEDELKLMKSTIRQIGENARKELEER